MKTAILNNDAVQYKTNITLFRQLKSSITNADGKWELLLEETDNMEAGSKYWFDIDAEKFIRRAPNTGNADFHDLPN